MTRRSSSPAYRGSFSVLDVAGMNYGEARYELDRELFPNRVIVGSETFTARSRSAGNSCSVCRM